MFEYEKKIMLTEDEYISILTKMCKRMSLQTQTNYYFDNDDLTMNKKGITWRVRAKGGKYIATVKNHNVDETDCSVEVDLCEKGEFDPEIFSAFGLRHQGELITDRVVMHKDSLCEMVLDKNVYLGYTDFELEVEYCKGYEYRAQMLIEKVGRFLVETKQHTSIEEFSSRVSNEKTKSQRFFDRLKMPFSLKVGDI